LKYGAKVRKIFEMYKFFPQILRMERNFDGFSFKCRGKIFAKAKKIRKNLHIPNICCNFAADFCATTNKIDL